MKFIFISIIALTFSASVSAGESLPADIQNFVSNAEGCDHLAGEYDGESPKKERDVIIKNLHLYCGRAQKQLPMLKKKYQGHSKLLKIINENANDSVLSYTK